MFNQAVTCYHKGLKNICVLVLSLFLIVSCHSQNQEDFSHPGYFDNVFHKAEQLKSTHPNLAIKFLDSAFNAFPHPGIQDLFNKYRFMGGYFFDLKNNDAKVLLYNDSALWVIRDHIHDKAFVNEYSDALFNRGFLLIQQKRYAEAFAVDIEAKNITEQNGNNCSLSGYSVTLGWISNLQGKYLNAARYTKQGLQEMSNCGSDNYTRFVTMVEKADDVGIYYYRYGMQDSAMYYYKSALDLLNEGKSKFAHQITDSGKFITVYTGIVYGNLGSVYYKKGDTAAAERLFKESLRINDRVGFEPGDSQYTLIKLATLYLAQNRLVEANPVLNRLRYSLAVLPDKEKDKEIKYYRLQMEYFGRTGKTKEAYQITQSYLKLQDSLAAVKPIPQVDVNLKYESLKNKYDLVVLKKKDDLKTVYLLAIILFSLLAVGILFFILNNLKRSRKHVAELTYLNNKISEENTQKQKALSALEQSQEENTKMMQIVAHDLRNPIGGITSIATLMLDDDGRSEDDRMMLELIKTSGQNSLDLVSDLLQVHTKVEELKKEPVDLYLMLRYCVDQLHHKAEAKGQRIDLQAKPIMVSVNRGKIWRVVSNLIANAIKFSPSRAVIVVKLEEKSRSVLISVKDDGIGIPVEMKDKIFDMFTEAKRAGTAGEQPYGLGLAISKQIVESHGGKIWFESNKEQGTIFYVELPLS